MAALRDLQESFRAAILAGTEGPLLPLVRGDGLDPSQRLQVYRNNVLASLAEALQANFPVVGRLVGEAFFRSAAHAFIRAHPPRRPSLAEYGDGFAEFLAGFPPAQPLPYLPDVARLEWAVGECLRAEAGPALDPQSLAPLGQAEAATLQLALRPGCRLFDSRYPVDRIWAANQPAADASQAIDLDSGGCRILIACGGEGTELLALDAPAFAFVNHIAGGSPLAAAYGEAAALHGAFDLAALLARLFRVGAFATPPG